MHRLIYIHKAVHRSEKTLSFWLWAKAELSNFQSVESCPQMHTETLDKDGKNYCFQPFEEIYVQPLTNH